MPKMLSKVLKSLVSRPATVRYPYVKPEAVAGTRGKITFDMKKCDLCQDCERVCPSLAIKVFPNEKRIEYSPFRCLYCHLCVESCMQMAIIPDVVVRAPEFEKVIDIFEIERR